jgi:MFS family permease
VLWGILGDKKGRLSVLVGSILLYSLANAANGLVGSVGAYAWLRFVAGVGLAGELGAGVTLVSEMMPAESRGYGTMLIAGVGILGGAAAGVVGHVFAWRTSYFIGGAMGLVLLALRVSAHESGLFARMKDSGVRRGDLSLIFADRARLARVVCCVLAGVPIWLVFGILVTFSPELGRALGMAEPPNPATAMTLCCVGCGFGDFVSGALSQWAGSRRRIVRAFLWLMAALVAAYLLSPQASPRRMYALILGLGVATGYWAVFMAMAAEQFGTNIRATVTTTVPNLVRGANVPMNLAFVAAKSRWGALPAAAGVGVVVLGLALAALGRLEETFGKPLDFVET